jgi:hypothetical protein
MAHSKPQLLTLWNHRVTVSQNCFCLDRILPAQGIFEFDDGRTINHYNSAESCPIKTINWWLITLGFFKCGFHVSENVFKSIFNFDLKLWMWRHLEVEVSSWRWIWASNIFWEHKTKFHEVYVKYGHLIDFIRLDPTEIRRWVGQTPLAVSAWVERPAPVFSCL